MHDTTRILGTTILSRWLKVGWRWIRNVVALLPYHLPLISFGIAAVSITIASALMSSWPAGLFAFGMTALVLLGSSPIAAQRLFVGHSGW